MKRNEVGWVVVLCVCVFVCVCVCVCVSSYLSEWVYENDCVSNNKCYASVCVPACEGGISDVLALWCSVMFCGDL